jgi:4-aminobutyrate aminotransferase-like enzyme
MLLPIEANQVKQDFEPLLGRKTPVVGAVRGVGLGVAIELAHDTGNDTLHTNILSGFPQAQQRRIHYNQ